MGQINHIIVALEISGASKNGLDAAIDLAKLTGAKITCVTAIVVNPTLIATVINYRKAMTKKAETMLESKREYCEKQEIQFAFKVLHGDPSSEITMFAEKQKANLIVIGSKGLGGITRKIFGSVVNSVVHESKVSVLVIK